MHIHISNSQPEAGTEDDRWMMTVQEFQRLSGLSRDTCWKLVRENRVESVKVLNRRLINRKSAQELLGLMRE